MLFYSPSCRHCVTAAAMYKDASQEAKKLGLPPFAAVNCGRNQEVCKSQAKMVPTLRFFSSSSWDPNAGTFDGPRTAVALVRFVRAKTGGIPEDTSDGYVCFDKALLLGGGGLRSAGFGHFLQFPQFFAIFLQLLLACLLVYD